MKADSKHIWPTGQDASSWLSPGGFFLRVCLNRWLAHSGSPSRLSSVSLLGRTIDNTYNHVAHNQGYKQSIFSENEISPLRMSVTLHSFTHFLFLPSPQIQ